MIKPAAYTLVKKILTTLPMPHIYIHRGGIMLYGQLIPTPKELASIQFDATKHFHKMMRHLENSIEKYPDKNRVIRIEGSFVSGKIESITISPYNAKLPKNIINPLDYTYYTTLKKVFELLLLVYKSEAQSYAKKHLVNQMLP